MSIKSFQNEELSGHSGEKSIRTKVHVHAAVLVLHE